MSAVITVLHVLVCVFMIAVILLQRGKGADAGAVFGGAGSSTVFGSRGAGNFLTKLTTASAVVFMVTSMTLSIMGTSGSDESLFDDVDEPFAEETDFEEVKTVPAEAPANAFEEVPQPEQ